jgi:hypothetical protein
MRSLLTITCTITCALAGLYSTPAPAAPAPKPKSARVTVDRKGVLRIPVATLRQLGVKPDREGSVWVEFPTPPTPKRKVRSPLSPNPPQQSRVPIRVLTPVDKGLVTIGRTRIDTGDHIPGAPGTVYLATGAANTVMLKKP